MKQRHKQYWVVVLINTFLLHHAALANPVFVPQFLSGGTGRNIRHLPCVSRRTGETGVCMFAFTCAKANGTHLGTCIDRFYFGSCCKIEEEPDVFPQDNTIDIDNPLALPKPFIITSTTPASESNDIPGNIDKVKLTTRPEGVTASVVTTLRSTSIDQVKTKPSKVASKKPVTTEFTTESIRLSTFQTVQNESEPSSTVSSVNLATTSKRPQRPSISNFKPLSPRPKPVITTTTSSLISENDATVPVYTSPSRPNVPASSSKPSSSALPSTTTIHHRNTTTHTTKKPTPTFGTKPDSTVITRPNFSTTAHRNTTVSSTVSTTHKRPSESTLKPSVSTTSTQRTPPTRFPPRNATTEATSNTEKISSQTVAPSTSSASPSTASSTINITTTSKSTTRKPTTTKKFTKPTTKRPTSVTKKPSPTTVTRRPPTLTTHATVHTIPPSFATTIPPSSFTTTKDVFNLTSADSISSTPTTTRRTTKKPLTTIPNKTSTVTKRPLPTTSSVIATTVKKPTTTLRRNVTSSSTRPITTIPPKSTITTHKPTTPSTAPASVTSHQPSTTVTTVRPTTSKITTSTTKVTKKPTKPNQPTTVTNTPRPISTTTTKTSAFTSSEIQTNIKPITQSHVPLTSVTSSSSPKNETLSPLNTTALTNEIDSEFNNEMDQTTAVPGIVTWSSFSDDVESTTKNVEYSSISPEITETSWTPITTPDGWIIIQSPTSEKTETQGESGIKPAIPTTETTLTSVKPTTESTTTKQTTTPSTTTTTTTPTPTTTTTTTTSTTTQRATTQPTTYVDMLSTLATVTVAPEFTEPPAPALNMSNFKEVCGRRLFPEARIVGGDGSTFGKWPWQISLRQWRTSTYLHKCGAALLNENWAITAAHCVQNVLPSDLLLRIGEHDLGNEEEPYGFQERRVQIVASHPNFDPRTFEFDLALMRFYEPVLPFQPNVLPICVPDDDEDYVGQTAYVTGWGRLYEDGPLPSVLQEVAVPVINNSVCEGMYRNAGYIEHIPHIFICAGWRKGGFDSCEGDSGGPLVIQRKRDKRWMLAGVISWGIGCAEPNQPGVYTRISEFREWINQILQF